MVRAGSKARASNIVKPKYIKKASSESLTSNTTLQNDDDFVISLEADKVYHVALHAMVTGPAAGDIKFEWAVTGGVAALTNRHVEGPATTTADVADTNVRSSGAHALTTSVPYGVDGSSGSRIVEDFLVETTTAGTAGTLTLKWAQNTSNASATAMNVNSFLIVTEVEAV